MSTIAATPEVNRRSVLALVAGALGGLLAGVDAILMVFLAVMLNGPDADDLVVPGVGHAGWSAASGVELGLSAGGVVILAGMAAAGAVLTWFFLRRRDPLPGPPRVDARPDLRRDTRPRTRRRPRRTA